jgi:hypothetical protein
MSIASEIGHPPLEYAFPNLPAVPIDLEGMADTLVRLGIRAEQGKQAKQGLTNTYTVDGVTDTGYGHLFGEITATPESEAVKELAQTLEKDRSHVIALFDKLLHERIEIAATPPDATTQKPLSLDEPEQFSMSWTTFPGVYEAAQPLLPAWTSSLTDPEAATAQFWPMIAGKGFAYNLLVTEKLTEADRDAERSRFQDAWSGELDAACAAGNLYVIDLSRFQALRPQQARGACRFTPSTVTLLVQDPGTKALTPAAVLVSGHQGQGAQRFTRANATDGAWLYALQAAKASITVFGIWLGHVYHWHLVTTAMQMTALNKLPPGHLVRQLLAPQSKYAIPFDDVLLLLWPYLAPPTSITSALQFLDLMNNYGSGRSYFDDDPKTTLAAQGITEADFSLKTPWDQYPVVAFLLSVWQLVETYVTSFVDATYSGDAAVAADSALQTWISTSSAGGGGNIRGLPEKMDSRAALTSVLTSLLYRITAHGVARLNAGANPALTFVANFPPCLQISEIPAPTTQIDTKQLLAYLPNTETIGEAVNFYFIFVFSPPYEPLIPLAGVEANLFFPNGVQDPRNQALIQFRSDMLKLIKRYEPETPQLFQWPLNIET